MNHIISSVGLPELLAIASSFTFAISQILIRLGMRTTTPLAAAFIINGTVSLTGLITSLIKGTLFTSTLTPVLWFALVGLVGPGLGRVCYLNGITRMGLGRSVTITSSAPLWSTLIAVIILGETPNKWVIIGTMGIVCGVSLLSIQENDSRSFKDWLQGALIFPLVASVAYALPPLFSKYAYAYQQTPEVGIAVAFFAANLFLVTFKPFLPGDSEASVNRAGFLWIVTAGLFSSGSSFFLWTAIMLGDVSTTMPLSRTAPIYILILSYFFLKKMEFITRRMVIGTLLVVIGGVLITALR
ncbi:MAG: DMT family transporter [Nitrospinaceae bacterium]|nr:DMT family transporter [Nitrospinaceae bacterium]MBT3435074.1 DMT family transporter [Nitrospinaceae bacterium]MBT3821832.1 DMT family transporter [Nitrospinaceae bacterium]MBT4095559.1 DMT family transporter [Nitrospinaceae bacterium]MBT5368844.1 DMT family transporter [Nitrospinaceae bacterium]